MYHVDQSTHRHHRIRTLLVSLGVVIVAVAAVVIFRTLQPDTVVRQGGTTTTHVGIAVPKTKVVTGDGVFQISLPDDWQSLPPAPTVYTEYSWHGTGKDDNARQLDIYVDNLPTGLAVNRLLPVQANGNGVLVLDSVSDNCINFTDKSTANPNTGAAPAKWSGISFLCDTANYVRDVVGTSSTEGINTVSLTGHTQGTHSFLFVYTDHSGEADYDTFTDALKTFEVL